MVRGGFQGAGKLAGPGALGISHEKQSFLPDLRTNRSLARRLF